MNNIEEELRNCFIPVSESNTEDEMFRGLKLKHSDLDSEVQNKASSRDGVEAKILRKYKENKTNPNLVYQKEKSKIKVMQNKLNVKSRAKSTKPKNTTNETSSNINSKNMLKLENNEIIDENNSNKILELNKIILQLRNDKLFLEEENAILKLEKEKSFRIKETQIATLNEKLMKLEIENSKLNEINNFSKQRLEDYNPKIFKYEETLEKLTKLEKEYEKIQESNSTLNTLLCDSKKEKEDKNSKFDIIRIENDALKNDKFYLSRENMTLNEKLQNSNDKIKNLEDDLREIRKTNQNYLDKLTEKNFNIENTFEGRLKTELEDMKKKYEVDKENLKRLFEELADKRCSYLMEEKDEYKMKTLKYEKVIKDKDESIEFLNNEMRILNKKTDEEISFLRIQLKIKSEDFERITNLYEETNQMLKLLKLESESIKDKNDLIRTELIRKESDFRGEISEYKAQLSIFKEKIANYELIENELDKVIIDSAVLANEDNEVINIIKDIPTSSKRRISQCLVLANKVKILTVEVEKQKDMVKKLEENSRLVSDERDIYKNVADKSKQPYSYLIKNLQEMELELYRKAAVLEEKELSVKSLLRENEMLSEKLKAVEGDMKVLLNNRKKLESLEEIISRFIIDGGDCDAKFNNNQSFNSNNNISTKFNTHARNLNTQNIISQTLNKESIVEIPERPERDFNNSNSNSKVPNWYLNLKMKNQMK